MLPLSFKIELNTLNKTKQNKVKLDEAKVKFFGVTSVVSFLSSCVFFSFTFLFSFSMFFAGWLTFGKKVTRKRCKIWKGREERGERGRGGERVSKIPLGPQVAAVGHYAPTNTEVKKKVGGAPTSSLGSPEPREGSTFSVGLASELPTLVR